MICPSNKKRWKKSKFDNIRVDEIPYESGNLYVGDSKFGSRGNRASVVSQSDHYLLPLSLVQLGQNERRELIKNTAQSSYEKVETSQEEDQVLITEDFETLKELDYQLDSTDGTLLKWTQRQSYALN